MSDKKYLSYYYLCYPQLVGTIQLSGGGGTSRNIYMKFLRIPGAGKRSACDMLHFWYGFEIKMNFDIVNISLHFFSQNFQAACLSDS